MADSLKRKPIGKLRGPRSRSKPGMDGWRPGKDANGVASYRATIAHLRASVEKAGVSIEKNAANVLTARAAKEQLAATFSQKAWFRGVGIVPTPTGLGLRLNVAPTVADLVDLPKSVGEFPVEVVFLEGYEPRPG